MMEKKLSKRACLTNWTQDRLTISIDVIYPGKVQIFGHDSNK
jgi:hypothetical protein